jgi:hypothetical protein
MPDCRGDRSECRLAGLVRTAAKAAQSGKSPIAEDASARPDYTYLNIRMRSWGRAIASQAVAVNVRRSSSTAIVYPRNINAPRKRRAVDPPGRMM